MHKKAYLMRRSRAAGFSLIELLVVIAIIGILSSIVLSSIGGADPTTALNNGVDRAHASFDLARSTAASKKRRTRVLINYDARDEARAGRFIAVAFEDPTSTPASPQWRLVADAVYMPEGVFFSKDESVRTGLPNPTIWRGQIDGLGQVVHEAGPVNATAGVPPAGTQPVWYVYEFAANGTSLNPGAFFVVGRGLLDQSGANNLANAKLNLPHLRGGLRVYRSGRTARIQDPTQID